MAGMGGYLRVEKIGAGSGYKRARVLCFFLSQKKGLLFLKKKKQEDFYSYVRGTVDFWMSIVFLWH